MTDVLWKLIYGKEFMKRSTGIFPQRCTFNTNVLNIQYVYDYIWLYMIIFDYI